MPTFSPDSLLAVRFHNARPGLELVTIIDAALPVAPLTLSVEAQERKQLPLLDEFVLRLVSAKVNTTDGIGGVLGLEPSLVAKAVAEQFSLDHLTYGRRQPDTPAGRSPLRLTDKGQRAANELTITRPQRTEMVFVWDQLLRKVRPYDRHAVITKYRAGEDDLMLLPAGQHGDVQAADLSLGDLNLLLKDREDKREILVIRRVAQAPAARYLPAKVLVYADEARTDLQLGVVVDGELSHPHEIALLGCGGAQALGITVEAAPPRPTLHPDFERARIPLAEVTRRRAGAAQSQGAFSDSADLPHEEERDEIRAISVFEHPDLLDEALTSARRRILLISPWIRKKIVTTDFIAKLEGRLRAGVQVDIAYGYSDKPEESDADAIRRLHNLARRYSENFRFTRLKSTHAKVLLFDDVWITTSFNWLSFKGDPTRTFRSEEGTLVRGHDTADEQHQRYLDQITSEQA
ncbi:hypothetical protein DN069_27940 [Streptacidiphilus pinicola]|uniref:Phospholipase D-like domain-containing protein n=1 Tax=Streptacidiphilus pinicola TaxID=2219663 RepID=A0A2X0JZH5_9ACTN|nr:hypothetical protein [Streptacidiphilus pinicola]RAG82355.1 hypothetical protein DN069_27940 [Streptacidiphilus pinicola]